VVAPDEGRAVVERASEAAEVEQSWECGTDFFLNLFSVEGNAHRKQVDDAGAGSTCFEGRGWRGSSPPVRLNGVVEMRQVESPRLRFLPLDAALCAGRSASAHGAIENRVTLAPNLGRSDDRGQACENAATR